MSDIAVIINTALICLTVLAGLALLVANPIKIKIIRANEVPPPVKEDAVKTESTKEPEKPEQPRQESVNMDGVIRSLNTLMGINTVDDEEK